MFLRERSLTTSTELFKQAEDFRLPSSVLRKNLARKSDQSDFGFVAVQNPSFNAHSSHSSRDQRFSRQGNVDQGQHGKGNTEISTISGNTSYSVKQSTFDIEAIPGSRNHFADFLSRSCCDQTVLCEFLPVFATKLETSAAIFVYILCIFFLLLLVISAVF